MAVVVKKTVTKKKSTQIIRISESIYDSPDSEDEIHGRKRSRSDDSSSSSRDAYNQLHAEKLQNLIQKYKKSFVQEIPEKIPLSNFRDLSSLKPGNTVHESCLNDWAKHLISVFNLSESVLFIPTYLYQYFFKNGMEDVDAEKIIRYLANNKAIKKDYILIAMPATPTNYHWILGLIMLDSKKITILDPIAFSPGIDSRHYTNLLRLTLLAHKLADIEFKLDQWQLYHPLNIPRTFKEEDAGVFVCNYIYKIVFRQTLTSLLDKNAKDYRRRIHYVLSSAKEILPQGNSKKYLREILLQYTQCLRQNFAPFSEKVNVQSFDAIEHNSVSMMSSGECADLPFCAQGLTSCDDMNQVKCIGCRKYFHYRCAGVDVSVDYFKCDLCAALI